MLLLHFIESVFELEDKRFVKICPQINSERFCLRARPLNSLHNSALQRFLSVQK